MATPTLIQHISVPNIQQANNDGNVSPVVIRLPKSSLSGNCIIVTAAWDSTAGFSAFSVDDNQSQSYTQGIVRNVAADGMGIGIWYFPNTAAGVTQVKFHYTGTAQPFMTFRVSEFNNIATSSPGDGSHGNGSAGANATDWNTGSFTPTTDGDLIYYSGISSNLSYNGTGSSFTPGTNFTLLSADLRDSHVSEYFVQSSHAAINPTVTSPQNLPYVAAAIALKSASAGNTPAAGINLVRLQYQDWYTANGTGTFQFQFPCTGNLLLVTGSLAAATVTAISDSHTNTWTQATGSPKTGDGTGGTVILWYAQNATTSTDMTITITFGGTNSGLSLVFWDISGAAATAYDTSTSAKGTANAYPVTTASLTPAGAGELVVYHSDQETGTITGLNGSGFVFTVPNWNGQNDGAIGSFTMDSGTGYKITTDASAVTFVETGNGVNATGNWEAVVGAFKAAGGGGLTIAQELPALIQSTASGQWSSMNV